VDEVLHAENERLTEERNALQQTIRQLEQRISALETQTTADTAPAASEFVSVHVLFYLSSTMYK